MKINTWKHFLLPVVLFLIITTFITLSYCKKDTVCHSVILVKNRYTNKAIPNAKIVISCGDPRDAKCTIHDSGLTSIEGKYLYNRPLEIILNVQVFVDTLSTTPITLSLNDTIFRRDTLLYGWDLLRLESGKTVDLTIMVDRALH